MSKKHIPAKMVANMLRAQSQRAAYMQQMVGHLTDTKHNKSWAEYGYTERLTFKRCHTVYSRIGLAAAVVDRMVDMCWLDHPVIRIDEDTICEHIEDFAERIELWPTLKDLDTYQSVGAYATMFVRVADGKRLSEPLEKVSMDNILELVPLWQDQMTPVDDSFDTDPSSPRYNLPEFYMMKTDKDAGLEQIKVHHTRVILWNEGASSNTIYGTSRLEKPFNALMDWEKLRGAGAEGFWRNAAMRSVLQDTIAPGEEEYSEGPDEEDLDDLNDTIRDMMSSFDSVPYLGGMELKTLQAALTDSTSHAKIVLEDVAAGAGWSAKGLVGAQTGVLAGNEDGANDRSMAQSRRKNFLNRMIKRFIRWLGDHTDYDCDGRYVEWPDLLAPAFSQKLENSNKMYLMRDPISGESVFDTKEIREVLGYVDEEETDA